MQLACLPVGPVKYLYVLYGLAKIKESSFPQLCICTITYAIDGQDYHIFSCYK